MKYVNHNIENNTYIDNKTLKLWSEDLPFLKTMKTRNWDIKKSLEEPNSWS